jgi:hypothetical protein
MGLSALLYPLNLYILYHTPDPYAILHIPWPTYTKASTLTYILCLYNSDPYELYSIFPGAVYTILIPLTHLYIKYPWTYIYYKFRQLYIHYYIPWDPYNTILYTLTYIYYALYSLTYMNYTPILTVYIILYPYISKLHLYYTYINLTYIYNVFIILTYIIIHIYTLYLTHTYYTYNSLTYINYTVYPEPYMLLSCTVYLLHM